MNCLISCSRSAAAAAAAARAAAAAPRLCDTFGDGCGSEGGGAGAAAGAPRARAGAFFCEVRAGSCGLGGWRSAGRAVGGRRPPREVVASAASSATRSEVLPLTSSSAAAAGAAGGLRGVWCPPCGALCSRFLKPAGGSRHVTTWISVKWVQWQPTRSACNLRMPVQELADCTRSKDAKGCCKTQHPPGLSLQPSQPTCRRGRIPGAPARRQPRRTVLCGGHHLPRLLLLPHKQLQLAACLPHPRHAGQRRRRVAQLAVAQRNGLARLDLCTSAARGWASACSAFTLRLVGPAAAWAGPTTSCVAEQMLWQHAPPAKASTPIT